jgi:hypothetical protein
MNFSALLASTQAMLLVPLLLGAAVGMKLVVDLFRATGWKPGNTARQYRTDAWRWPDTGVFPGMHRSGTPDVSRFL